MEKISRGLIYFSQFGMALICAPFGISFASTIRQAIAENVVGSHMCYCLSLVPIINHLFFLLSAHGCVPFDRR